MSTAKQQGGSSQLQRPRFEAAGVRIPGCGSLGEFGSQEWYDRALQTLLAAAGRCWCPMCGRGVTIPDTDPDSILVIPLTVGAGFRIEGIDGTACALGPCGSWTDAISQRPSTEPTPSRRSVGSLAGSVYSTCKAHAPLRAGSSTPPSRCSVEIRHQASTSKCFLDV